MHPSRGGGEDGSAPKGGGGDDDTLESGGYHHNNHPQKFSGVALTLRITLVLAVVGVTCLLLNQSNYYPLNTFFRNPNSFLGSNTSSPPPLSCENSNSSKNLLPTAGKEVINVELEETLRKAAMEDNRTVIITTLNAAWAAPGSVFDLFLESFRIGEGTADLLKHVVVGAFDQAAFDRCAAEGLHCYAVTTEGVDFSGEEVFMSEDYLKMMWRRIDFLRSVLELGYDFVFTDADVMWLRDPFKRFYPDGEFQIACDHFWANYTDPTNSPNGGFNYVKSSNRTVKFYDYWYEGRQYFPGKHDQDVLNMVKFNPFIPEIGLEMQFLDTADFGGFCEANQDLDRVVTMHANCCIGLENKMHDLRMVIDDWKRYVSTPADERNDTTRSWTVPRICG